MISEVGAFIDDQYQQARARFIKVYVEDPDTKDTVIVKFHDKDFEKPAKTTINDHFTWINTVYDYIDLLPSTTGRAALTKDEQRYLFYNSFPKTWKEDYRKLDHDILTATVTQVKDQYMSGKKADSDKAYKKKKSDENNKENNKKERNQD